MPLIPVQFGVDIPEPPATALTYGVWRASGPTLVDDTAGSTGGWLVPMEQAERQAGDADWADADHTLHIPAGVYLVDVAAQYPGEYPDPAPRLDVWVENGTGIILPGRTRLYDSGQGVICATQDTRLVVGYDSEQPNIGSVLLSVVRLGS